jgi:DNA polymerase-3 subunit delta
MAKGRCYLFLGPEIGEKQDAIDEIRQTLTVIPKTSTLAGQSTTKQEKKAGIPPEETSFYAGETSATDMVSALLNGSLFADIRLFLIKNAEALKKDEIDLLTSYMGSPQEDTTLILVSEASGIDKRLENAVPGENKRIFWELFENRKKEWVETFFRRGGYQITGGALRRSWNWWKTTPTP